MKLNLGKFLLAMSMFFILATLSFATSPPYQGVDGSKIRGFTCYNNLTEEDVLEAKEIGANTLRIMLMIHDLHDLSNYDTAPDPRLDYQKLMKLKNVIRVAMKHNIMVIIDVHEIPGLVRWSGWKDFRLWDDIVGYRYQNFLIRTWQQLAEEFKDYPEEAVVFELLNEPEPKWNDWNAAENQGYKWDQLQAKLVREIRKIDSKHTIIAAPPYGWRINSFDGWTPPAEILNDTRVMVTAHHYHPHDYTIQWQPWVVRKDKDAKPADIYPGEFTGHIWKKVFWDKKRLEFALSPIKSFQEKYPNIPVVVTEFSVIRIAPGAKKWISDTISILLDLNVGWTYHAFKEQGYLKDKKGADDTMWELDIKDIDGTHGRLEAVKKGMGNFTKQELKFPESYVLNIPILDVVGSLHNIETSQKHLYFTGEENYVYEGLSSTSDGDMINVLEKRFENVFINIHYKISSREMPSVSKLSVSKKEIGPKPKNIKLGEKMNKILIDNLKTDSQKSYKDFINMKEQFFIFDITSFDRKIKFGAILRR